MIDVIILLAGKGTRFKALQNYHKALLPYNNKTILEHIIENIEKITKNTRFIFVVNFQYDKIVSFIHKNFLDKNYIIVKQQKLDGPLQAINEALPFVKSKKILVHLGDIICNDNLCFKKDFVSVKKVDDFHRWCLINNKTREFFDKPIIRPNTNLALSGLYFFTNKKMFIESVQYGMNQQTINNEYQLSEMLKKYDSKQKFKTLEININDFGNIDDFLKSTNFMISRECNNINDSSNNTITKKSIETKIFKESFHLKFLKNILKQDNNDFKFLTPEIYNTYYQNGACVITLEKIDGQLSDYYYVFEKEDLEYCEKLFIALLKTLKHFNSFKLKEINNDLQFILYSRNCNHLQKYYDKLNKDSTLLHGDYHLGNMILKNNKITLIDASGRISAIENYDLAKLLHSIIYDYNVIKFNLYTIKNEQYTLYNEHLIQKKQLFLSILNKMFSKTDIKQAKIITMLLFKTMQPLHKDNLEHVFIFEQIHQKLKKEIDNEDYDIHIW